MSEEKPKGHATIHDLDELSHPERYRLLGDVLDFFVSDPEFPDARPLRELRQDAHFAGYSPKLLGTIVQALVTTGLLFRPPQAEGRDRRYLTIWLGREARELYRRAQTSGEDRKRKKR